MSCPGKLSEEEKAKRQATREAHRRERELQEAKWQRLAVQQKAMAAVASAVRRQVLQPLDLHGVLCVDCNESAYQYHHHLGYEPEHWLDVVPLCYQCHGHRHKRKITTGPTAEEAKA